MTVLELRTATHMKQVDFAALLGVPKSTLQKWEYRNEPPEYIRRLIEYYLRGEGYITADDTTDNNL